MLLVVHGEGLGGDSIRFDLLTGDDDGDLEGCTLTEGLHGGGELLAVGRAFFVVFLLAISDMLPVRVVSIHTLGSFLTSGTRKVAMVAMLLLWPALELLNTDAGNTDALEE